MTGVIMRTGEFGYRHVYKHIERTPEAKMSSCKPRDAKGFSVPQETRKRKGSLLPRVSEGAWPY